MILDETIHKLAKEKFASLEEKFNEKYNNYFDYSNSIFKGMNKTIKIICSKHGEFYQSPKVHLSSIHGCRKCFNDLITITIEQFIEKSNNIHNNKYDYSKSIFNGLYEYIKIICPEHGIFEYSPSNHLKLDCGCPYCKIKNQTISNEEYIKYAINKHNTKFNYSLVEFIDFKTPIKIICQKHGIQEQYPKYHITSNYGCIKCARHEARSTKVSKDEFIKKAISKYGDKFDYSNINYIDYHTEIELICPIHGKFNRVSYVFYNSAQGCKQCGNMNKTGHYSRYINKETILYYIKIYANNRVFYKFGLTLHKLNPENDINNRYSKDIKLGMKFDIVFYELFKNGIDAYIIEQKLKYETFTTYENMINLKQNIIPSNIGYTELRANCVLDKLKQIINNP